MGLKHTAREFSKSPPIHHSSRTANERTNGINTHDGSRKFLKSLAASKFARPTCIGYVLRIRNFLPFSLSLFLYLFYTNIKM